METKDILKTLRKSKGFTNMKDFCESADISINTYQNYETGKRVPTAEILVKLADFYGVTTDYLLGREPAPNPFADLNLSEDDEKEVMDKYMSLPPEIRACMLDVLIQLGDAAKKRSGKQSTLAADKNLVFVKEAARSPDAGNVPHNVAYTEEQIEELENSPDVNPDL